MLSETAKLDLMIRRTRMRFVDRDREMNEIYEVRQGNIQKLMPHLFSDDLPRSLVANTVDIVARDLAEVMAPLPTLDCAVGNGVTNADKQRAERKNRIGSSYWKHSKLQRSMFKFADHYNSYGLGLLVVEPDLDQYCPTIRVEDPRGVYYERDRWGCLRWLAKIWRCTASELAAMFPEHEDKIMGRRPWRRTEAEQIELIRYCDEDRTVLYLPECDHLPLVEYQNPLSRIPVAMADRWGLDDVPRGQFADVVWVQLARAVMAQYTLSAADKSINAPILLPRDITEFAIGSDAIISSDGIVPGVGRMRLDVPRDVFALGEQLDQSLKEGARYPDARLGGVQGSIITGRGVEAMLGTFDTQLKTAQELFKVALEDATSLCFEMDSVMWPDRPKKISGVQTGRPYELTYIPARDIKDSWECEVTYGFAAGLSPAQAMVALLQLRGDKLIGRETARAQLPFPIDPEREQRDIDASDLRDALMQGLLAATQAMGPMIQQGMPVEPLLLATAKVIADREKGRPLHEAVLEAFQQPEPEPAEPGMEPGIEGEEPELPPGVRDNGLMQGVAYGQAGMPPGGMPSIQSLIAGLRGENAEPRMSAEVLRKRGVGVG